MKLKNNLYFTTNQGVCVNIIGLMHIHHAYYYLYIQDDYNKLDINGFDLYDNLQCNRHILFNKLKTDNPMIGAAYSDSTRIVASLEVKQIMNKFINNDI